MQCFSDENVLVPKTLSHREKKIAKKLASVVVHTLKCVDLKGQSNFYMLYHWGGKGCIRFWGGPDQNSGWWQPKHSCRLILWGKCCKHKNVFILIRSSSYLLVIRTGIKYQISSISGQIELYTLELLARERWKKLPMKLQFGKCCQQIMLDWIFVKLEGNSWTL